MNIPAAIAFLMAVCITWIIWSSRADTIEQQASLSLNIQCDTHCGMTGSRTVNCMDANMKTVARSLCTGAEPANNPLVCQDCAWTQTYGPCSVSCGNGTRSVTYTCNSANALLCGAMPASRTEDCRDTSTCQKALDLSWTVTGAAVTAAPVTAAPVTAAPVTAAPVTAAPVTAAPVPMMVPQAWLYPDTMQESRPPSVSWPIVNPLQTEKYCFDICRLDATCATAGYSSDPKGGRQCNFYTSKMTPTMASTVQTQYTRFADKVMKAPGSAPSVIMAPQFFTQPGNVVLLDTDMINVSSSMLLGPTETSGKSCVDTCAILPSCSTVATPLTVVPGGLNLCYLFNAPKRGFMASGPPRPSAMVFTDKVALG